MYFIHGPPLVFRILALNRGDSAARLRVGFEVLGLHGCQQRELLLGTAVLLQEARQLGQLLGALRGIDCYEPA